MPDAFTRPDLIRVQVFTGVFRDFCMDDDDDGDVTKNRLSSTR